MTQRHFSPRKRFGQHFLHDPYIIQSIVDVIAPKENDHLVEIGPGLGALTQPVLAHVKHLEAIELDRDVIPELQALNENSHKLTLYQADALKFDFSTLTKKPATLRLIGNLPYNISTPLLFHLIEFAPLIKDMHFMLQKEVVERMAAAPGTSTYGRLSVMIQYYCQVDFLFIVPPAAFTPPPKVDSAVVRLKPHRPLPFRANNPTLFADIVREAFNHRRKVLRNSLSAFINKEDWTPLGINPETRAEMLSVMDYVRIANSLC